MEVEGVEGRLKLPLLFLAFREPWLLLSLWRLVSVVGLSFWELAPQLLSSRFSFLPLESLEQLPLPLPRVVGWVP